MRKVLALVMAVGVLIAGCSVASQAMNWAEEAVIEGWTAEYQILFHQEDRDVEMLVQETQGDTLVFEILMPSGTLRLEYDDRLLIDLDQGNLEWEDFSRYPPYYGLSELARQIMAMDKLERDGDWALVEGYTVKMDNGLPVEVKWGSEWTLYVKSFEWN